MNLLPTVSVQIKPRASDWAVEEKVGLKVQEREREKEEDKEGKEKEEIRYLDSEDQTYPKKLDAPNQHKVV